MPTVAHQPRVAFDAALVFVRAAGSPHSDAFAAKVLRRLGSEQYGAFADTRQRLLTALVETGNDAFVAHSEAGRWRVRLEDLLQARPELADVVSALAEEASGL